MGKIALKTTGETDEQAKKELETMFDDDLYNPVYIKIFQERP
jgi:phosphoribosylformylglycinamidine (FGAM) synthase PurS component